jgi:hypothetical protein
MSEFKRKHTFAERKTEADNIRRRYPDRVPLLVSSEDTTLKLTRKKFLIPEALTYGQCVFVVKKHCDIAPTEAVMMMVLDTLPQATRTMGDIYERYKDSDGFLTGLLIKERTFG